jgi:hypothetical protein
MAPSSLWIVGLSVQGRGRIWTLDPRIWPINTSPHYSVATGEIVPSQAIVLDCWTTTPGGALQTLLL